VLDGGYYPEGGMHRFPEALVYDFESHGGILLLSTLAKRIMIANDKIESVLIQDRHVKTKYVVSASDITTTLLDLIGEKYVGSRLLNKILNMKPSYSAFVVYLGINKSLEIKSKFSGIWYAPFYLDYNNKKYFVDDLLLDKFAILLCIPSLHSKKRDVLGKESIFLFINAPFKDIKFWKDNKDIIARKMIKRAEDVIPDLSKHIVNKTIFTPYDFHRYTFNRDGAIRGWLSIPSQIGNSVLPKSIVTDELYCVGHWTQSIGQGGIILSANSGRSVANAIGRKLGM